jgi:hypothetical protein
MYKHHIKYSSVVAAFFLLISMFGQSFAQDRLYATMGTAYSLDDNKVLYREAYTAINEMGEVEVDYLDPQGNKFATKTLVFQGEPFQPTFVLQDSRDNETISVQFEKARLVMRHKDMSGPRQKIIFEHANMVIDAGFDSYIQLKWDDLLKGKELKFDYALPAKLSSVGMSAEKIQGNESPLYDKQYGDSWVYFRLQPAKKWMSVFSDPIYLAYDPNGKYLMRYSGRSAIDDAKGIPLDVRVEYEYF